MKVCTACQSAAVKIARGKPDECKRCGHTGRFHHLHQQTGNPSTGHYLGPGAYQKLKKPVTPN